MNPGNLSNTIIERSVLKNISNRSSLLMNKPAMGIGYNGVAGTDTSWGQDGWGAGYSSLFSRNQLKMVSYTAKNDQNTKI